MFTVTILINSKPCVDLARDIQEKFITNGRTLGCAESCTGGLLAASLPTIWGHLATLVGGINCYSNQVKENILGVKDTKSL